MVGAGTEASFEAGGFLGPDGAKLRLSSAWLRSHAPKGTRGAGRPRGSLKTTQGRSRNRGKNPEH